MQVSILRYVTEHSTTGVNHRVTYQFSISADEKTEFCSKRTLYLENKAFSVEGISNYTHYIRRYDQCPFFRFALLDAWSWSNSSETDERGWAIWKCECSYISPPIFSIDRPPYGRPTTTSYVLQRYEKVLEKAYATDEELDPSVSIETTAGEKFTSPPITGSDSEIVFSVEKNFYIPKTAGENSNLKIKETLLGAINSLYNKKILINGYAFERDQVKIDNIQPKVIEYIEDDNGNYTHRAYINAIVKVIARSSTHILSILNAGYIEKDDNDDPVRARTPEGDLVQSPVKLAQDGTRLSDGADPVYLNFRVNPYFDFIVLDLPKTYNPNEGLVFYQVGNVNAR